MSLTYIIDKVCLLICKCNKLGIYLGIFSDFLDTYSLAVWLVKITSGFELDVVLKWLYEYIISKIIKKLMPRS